MAVDSVSPSSQASLAREAQQRTVQENNQLRRNNEAQRAEQSRDQREAQQAARQEQQSRSATVGTRINTTA